MQDHKPIGAMHVAAILIALLLLLLVVLLCNGSPAIDLKAVSTADAIAILSAAIALAAFFVAFRGAQVSRADTLRVEKSNAYLQLEVASSDVFKYEAEHGELLEPYRAVRASEGERKALLANRQHALHAYNLYFQTLNLFEVCARFRRQDIIEHGVFASWVAWFYDTLDDWYFRDQWHDLRGNYTDDVRDIFDLGMKVFEKFGNHDEPNIDAARKKLFYEWVGQHMQCTEIGTWPQRVILWAEAPAPWPDARQLKAIRSGRSAPPTALRRPPSSPAS